jgi:hypothetical protein
MAHTEIQERLGHAARVSAEIEVVERRMATQKQEIDDFVQDIAERKQEVKSLIVWHEKRLATTAVMGHVPDTLGSGHA